MVVDLRAQRDKAFDIDPNAMLISRIAVDDIVPNPKQPRQNVNPKGLEELASSLKEHGLIQPITVQPYGDSQYMIVTGERRWRAAKLLSWKSIDAIVIHKGDTDALSLIENVQRENLTPVDEALAYKRLKKERSLSNTALAKIVGKKKNTVGEILSITELPDSILSVVDEYPGVTKTHLVQIAKTKDRAEQEALWAKAKLGRLTTTDMRESRSGGLAVDDLSPATRALNTLSRGVTKLEKIDRFNQLNIEELKKLRGRINKVLKTKS